MKIGMLKTCRCIHPRIFSLSSNAVGGEGWGEEERKENGHPSPIYRLSLASGINLRVL
jgi:hypothetical protein